MNKSFWKSKSFWASVTTGLLAVYSGLTADGIVPALPPNTLAAVLGVLSVFGIYSRAVAGGKLTL